ncbi:glycosyltransferase [Thioclava pacifica]|uniref:Glycosyltransferase subfamily 4-like N-terminal domain-containing protein n=1 Tax=Thioclava pacifica DSM 10166 TaxID=1353537 RepID=A0A074JAQ6_9RHOB|nr:glycosyltransferase [Thioclava pacifica]KEO54701.1 hypothetical protein TP2_17350 [Thioclava pacifica DSM 10166]
MNVLIGVQNLAAERLAGTEHYVLSLAQELAALGADVTVVAPAPGKGTRMEDFGGVKIRYFGDGSAPTKGEILGQDEPRFLDEFASILRETKADLFHLHSSSSVMGIAHQRLAKAAGIKTVISLHVPGWFCARYDFMFEGKRQCDATLRSGKCNRCAAKQRFGPLKGAVLASAAEMSGLKRAPIFRSLNAGTSKLDSLREHFLLADVVHVFADWQKEIMLRSGFREASVFLSRQGVREDFVNVDEDGAADHPGDAPIKVGFCGRINEIKGVNVLLKAISATDRKDIEFTIVGEPRDSIADKVQDLTIHGRTVACVGTLRGKDLVDWYQQMDVICAPSHCAETGPLVVMEAQALGKPVIASRLGGNAELISEHENGFLFDTGDDRQLAEVFAILTKETLQAMGAKSSYDRTMATVAGELMAEYARVLMAIEPDTTVGSR